MFPNQPLPVGVSIHIGGADPWEDTGFSVQVRVTYDNEVTATVFAQKYDGFKVDLVTDLAMEAASAFLYGEPGDVKRACQTNWRVARAHAAKHEYGEPTFPHPRR